jgi:hypothetical protein
MHELHNEYAKMYRRSHVIKTFPADSSTVSFKWLLFCDIMGASNLKIIIFYLYFVYCSI